MPAPKYDNLLDKLNSLLVEDDNGCWVCVMTDCDKGYGRFAFYGSKYYGHRAAWELTFGSIPTGLSVLHHCDNPGCCRPNHLFLGTQADNMHDMYIKGRHWSQKQCQQK